MVDLYYPRRCNVGLVLNGTAIRCTMSGHVKPGAIGPVHRGPWPGQPTVIVSWPVKDASTTEDPCGRKAP